MAAEIQLDVEINTDKAQKTLSSFSNNAVKSLSSIEGVFSAIKTIAVAAVAVVAGQKVISFLNESANAASESEDAILKLNLALASTGEFTKKASDNFQQLASDIQAQTGISDELVLKQVALAKSYSLTNAQTEKVIKAAVELSSVTGEDLNTSTEKLAKTYNGFSDKTLSRMIPGFKGLTEEQLKNGAAVDIIAQKYNGLAEKLSNTFSGSIAKTAASFGELQESIGRVFVENPAIIKLINTLGEVFNNLGEFFKKNQAAISEFINKGILILLKTIPYLVDVFAVLGQVVVGVAAEISFLTRDVLLLAGAFVRTLSLVKIGSLGEEAEKLADELADAAYNAGAFGVASQKAFNGLDKFAESTRKTTEKLVKDLEKVPPIVKTASKEFEKLNQKPVQLIDTKALQQKLDEAKAKLQGYFNDPINSLFKIDFIFDKNNLTAIGAGIFSSIAKGAAGAVELISAGLGQGLAALLGSPELAGPFTEIFKILSKGPEEVRKMISAFVEAIPVIIENIILAIPEVFDVLAEKMPEIIDRLVDRSPEIIEKLIEKMPDVATRLAISMAIKVPEKLIAAIPRVVGALISKLGEGLGKLFEDIGKGLLEALVKIPETILKALSDGISKIFNDLTGGLLGGGGGGLIGGIVNGVTGAIGGVVNTIGGLFGGGGGLFAKGGEVPSGFPTDTFKAKLTSGEMIIPRGDVDRLSSFLDRQQGLSEQMFNGINNSSEKNLTVVLNVGEDQLAKVLLNINRRGFRTV